MRMIQEQDEKIKLIQQEICQLAKENQLNKMVIQEAAGDQELIHKYIQNRVTLLKFDKVI